MEHRMRRIKQLLPHEDAIKILSEMSNGVLSLVDTDGEPYGVPLSYAFDGDSGGIYFHSAVTGHKISCIEGESRCSFCVIAQDEVMPEEFTTYFRSVIAKGNISIVSEPDEIIKGLRLLCDKYSPGVNADAEIEGCLNRVKVLRLDIREITGKQAIEFVGHKGS